MPAFALREVELREEQHQRDEDHRRVDEAVEHRVGDRTEQVRPAPDGRHERVLEGALPALDRDRLGDPAEHDRQVVPEDRPDHQRQQQRLAALVCTDERDRERARDGIDQEREFPAPVAAGQEEVALDEGVRGLQLMGDDGHGVISLGGEPARPLSGTEPDSSEGSAASRAPIRMIRRPTTWRMDGRRFSRPRRSAWRSRSRARSGPAQAGPALPWPAHVCHHLLSVIRSSPSRPLRRRRRANGRCRS